MTDVGTILEKFNTTAETAVKAVKEAVAEAPAKTLKTPKETKTVDPDALPKDEAHLVRSINVRMQRMEDHKISLIYELTELRKLTGARGLKWEAFCDKHILKPDGTPYAPKTIRDFIALGKEENVAKAIEDKRQQAVVRMREVHMKKPPCEGGFEGEFNSFQRRELDGGEVQYTLKADADARRMQWLDALYGRE